MNTKINERRLSCIGMLLLIGVVMLMYFPMLKHDAILDDPSQIVYVQTFEGWTDCLLLDDVGWFRPFKNVVFYFTIGEAGEVYTTKLVCLLLFIINVCLLFYLLIVIFESRLWALLGCALFALNPTMVSSVQFLSASNNQICLGFILVYLSLSLRYVDETSSFFGRSSVLCFALFALALAMGSYEVGVVSLGMFCVLSIVLLGVRDVYRGRSLIVLLSSCCITIGYLFIRFQAGAGDRFYSPSLPPDVSTLELILRAPYYAWRHFLLWAIPWGRGGVFIDDNPAALYLTGFLGWGLLVLVTLAAFYLFVTRFKCVAAGILLFLGGMVPLANFLGLANGPICNYYLLIPGIGLVVAICGTGRLLFEHRGQFVRALSVVLLLCALGALGLETIGRVKDWKSDLSLRDFTLHNYPDNYYQLTDRGMDRMSEGQTEVGTQMLERALEIAPWYPLAADNLAYAYEASGETGRALELLEQFHANRSYRPWRTLMRQGEILVQHERYEEANTILRELLKRKPLPGEECRFYLALAVPCMLAYGRNEEVLRVLELIEEQCGETVAWKALWSRYVVDVNAKIRSIETFQK